MQTGSRKTIDECTPEEWHEASKKIWDKDSTVFVPPHTYSGYDWTGTWDKTWIVEPDQYLGYNYTQMKNKFVGEWVKVKGDPGYFGTYGHSDFKEVEHPNHYVEGRKYEPWDVIEDWKLNYFTATALKYISRYERKGEPVRDLKKAIEFLKREIVRLEKEKS